MSSIPHKKAQMFLRAAKIPENYPPPKPLHVHPQQLSYSASEKCGGGVGGWGGGGDSAYLRTLSAAVAAAEFLTVAISRTPK